VPLSKEMLTGKIIDGDKIEVDVGSSAAEPLVFRTLARA
jgi:hypothetical protein